MTARAGKLAYTLTEAAEQVSVSVKTLRRAIGATDPSAYPPPLRAKNFGTERKPSYRILHAELEAWAESMGDA